LGDVRGMRVIDVGSGNGYLSRKLAQAGAIVTAVEMSSAFMEIATKREAAEKLGITYHSASATDMGFLPPASVDKAVANYVLMDVRDYAAAVREIFRILHPGGTFVAVISHPCGPGGWYQPAPDSPRREEQFALMMDPYFRRSAYAGVWANFDPVISFHRPLRDYWETFTAAGFRVEGFEEPSLTERGRR